jgi:hypothetical protein
LQTTAACGTLAGGRFAFGVMPMLASHSSLGQPHRSGETPRFRAGQIGPIRREIIFEPLPETAPPLTIPAEPVPAEPESPAPAPVNPATQPKEPVPEPL